MSVCLQSRSRGSKCSITSVSLSLSLLPSLTPPSRSTSQLYPALTHPQVTSQPLSARWPRSSRVRGTWPSSQVPCQRQETPPFRCCRKNRFISSYCSCLGHMTTPQPIIVAHREDYLGQFSYRCNPNSKRWSEFPQNLGPNMQEGRFSEEYLVFFEDEKALDTGRASPVAQMVKNRPAMWETLVQSPVWEDPLEEGMAIHSSILVWRIPMERGAWWATIHGVVQSQIWLSN